ncbi:SDR family NAD(P)-dependent oxidoreductase [Alkalicoccus saliphilus]|uniref:Oxidoreductase n=1 Tax=Alkalicoccus saliphilus TaxID=200989 RepID=A0A2T4U4G8_9BACI|nr:SDR family NAD(P)-dependent oxidoreductase [Alkalicoccus saliphilus]PTL38300.1 oxidoreductase [Alkalicoccus saliphilus]
MKPLEGKTALVTGASRGAGRAIAIELGRAGAFVYVTARSTRSDSTNNRPGTIDETIAEIKEKGGQGAPIRCDHTVDSQTKAVMDQIQREQGKLDILINNVWGAHDLGVEQKPFRELSLKNWDTMFTAGVRAQLAVNHFALPLLEKNANALIIHTTFWDEGKYTGQFYYDLAKNALVRMAYGLSIELAGSGITVLALSPGFMRTELVLKHFETDEEHWMNIPELRQSESPYYVGRAAAALAGDPKIDKKNGRALRTGDLAEEYGFTDIDGRRIPPFSL